MVNLVKTQENEAETPGTKQLDLKPMKQLVIRMKDMYPDENVNWVNRIMQPKNWKLQWDVKVKKIEPCMSNQLKFNCVQKCLLVIVKKTLKVILICQTVKKIWFGLSKNDNKNYIRIHVWHAQRIWESEISDTKLQRRETIMIMHLDQHILSFFEKGCQELLSCILAKLTATKKKNISCQNMSLLWNSSMLVDIATNNIRYTTICTNLHPTGET